MTVSEAHKLMTKRFEGMTAVDCVDLGDSYGFVFVEWNKKQYGPVDTEKAYKLFFITGWSTVNKLSGDIGEVNSTIYFDKYPDKLDTLRHIPISILQS